MAEKLIDSYADHMRMLGHSDNTIGGRTKILHRMDRDLPYGLISATAQELKGWIYRPAWSVQTRASYYVAARGLFAFLTRPEDPYLDYDPTTLLVCPRVPKGVPRPVTDQELASILARAAEPYRTWCLLAAYQGLRCIEISRLDREDISEQRTLLRGKGSKDRWVPTHPDVWAAVRDFPPGPVARDAAGRVTPHTVSDRAARYMDRQLGMPDVTMHRLRHWYGTRTLEACGNLRTVQELLGHASPASTAVYTQVTSPQREAAVAALPRFGAADAARAVGGGPPTAR